MLPNSELLLPPARRPDGQVVFADHPRVRQLTLDPDEAAATALLFPGEGAQDPRQVPAGAVRNLVVLDGTWAQARKLYQHNPILRALPRLGLIPARPGNYRIRREPAADCLATIEALAEALGALEQDVERFAGLLPAFTFMVDQQLAMAAQSTEPRHRTKDRPAQLRADAALHEQLQRAVVIHAEVNAHPRGSGVTGRPELLHLLARRLSSGECFEAVLAPRRSLAANAPFHVGVPAAAILAGETVAELRPRWRSYLQPGDVLCSWGSFTRDQLAVEDLADAPWLDLRLAVARRLQHSPGAPAEAAQRLHAAPLSATARGRAGRTIAALESIVAALAAPR
jgi:hypothetical protein